jgi:hypothetical protein
VGGKCDLVGELWFDLSAWFLQIRHSMPWETPSVQIAVVVLEVCSPAYFIRAGLKILPITAFQGARITGVYHCCWTTQLLDNSLVITVLRLQVVCYLAQLSPRKLLETRLSSSHWGLYNKPHKGILSDLHFSNHLCPQKCQCAHLKLFVMGTGRIKVNNGVGDLSYDTLLQLL